MNKSASVSVGIIDVSLTFPDVFGKTREELIHCIIAGDDPESMLPEQLRLWCEKHSISGQVRYRYEGTVDLGKHEIIHVGTGSWYVHGDDLQEPSCELFTNFPEIPEGEDIPF